MNEVAGLSSEIDYPDPPRVHWLALSGVFGILNLAVAHYAPSRYQDLLQSLVVDAWAFYLCLWIRRLDRNSLSPFWCDVYVVIELGFAATTAWPQFFTQIQWLPNILGLASAVLAIATIFLIRRDLLKHYNGPEDFTLVLGQFMTLCFSFVYFQYHLYDIAEQKMKERSTIRV